MKNIIREAAYLLLRYVNPRKYGGSENTIYEPPSPYNEGSSYQDNGMVVIELGSGMGVTGFAVAELLAQRTSSTSSVRKVILTDLPDVCQLLEENLSLRIKQWEKDDIQISSSTVSVRPLSWGNFEDARHIFDEIKDLKASLSILCSDLVRIPPLICTKY